MQNSPAFVGAICDRQPDKLSFGYSNTIAFAMVKILFT